MRDPYELLGVTRSATADDIKQSFRRLAKILHPDANKNNPKAAALFAELNAAHEILGDEEKRSAFDQGEVDSEDNPMPEVAAIVISEFTFSMISLIVAVAIIVASPLITRSLAPQMGMNGNSDSGQRVLSRVEERSEHLRLWSDSRLLFPQSVSYASPDAIPLGVQVRGKTRGLTLQISGLPRGTRIFLGRSLPGGRWRILATDVDDAMIHLPPGFSGAIDLAVELRLFDDTVIDHGSLRLEWQQTDPIETADATDVSESSAYKASAAPADQNTIQNDPDSQRDHEPIELLIGRSEKLLSEGNVEAARILLRPAAEAHDARAALALGATYDPIMLAILRARGIAADVSLALDWYTKASKFGSRGAQERLTLLATALVEPKRRVVRAPIHVAVSHLAAQPVSAAPDPSIRAQLIRDDASQKLPALWGVGY